MAMYGDDECTSDPPFVVGGARGCRNFYLDVHGNLRGVTYREAWVDGENIATCYSAKISEPGAFSKYASTGVRYPYETGGIGFHAEGTIAGRPLPGWVWDQCAGLAANCGCGYYAYHDHASPYGTGHPGPGLRVTGIVEGYGKVILGTRGYRAQKARILAVCVPKGDTFHEARAARSAMNRAIDDAVEHLKEIEKSRVASTALVMAVAAVAAAMMQPSPLGFGVSGALSALAVLTQINFRRYRTELIRTHTASIADMGKQLASLPWDFSEHIEAARKRYPSVQFFTDQSEMLAAVPVISMRALVENNEAKADE